MRVHLLGNPAAGSGQAGRLMAQAQESLAARGLEVASTATRSRAETRTLAAKAAADGLDAVIACGGDGTVHDVIQGLAGSRTALGVLPAGSGDDVCAGLGLVSGPAAAVATAIADDLAGAGPPRVDLGRARTGDGVDHLFASALCTGFDARVNARANDLPRLLGQRYVVAMLRELAAFSPLDYSISVDGAELRTRAMIVTVGNGPRYGGGMRICPAADVTDGELDLTILETVSRPRLLWSFRLVFSGRHVGLPFVRTLRGVEVLIDSPGQTAFADGERLGPLPVRVTTAPGALRVVGTAATWHACP